MFLRETTALATLDQTSSWKAPPENQQYRWKIDSAFEQCFRFTALITPNKSSSRGPGTLTFHIAILCVVRKMINVMTDRAVSLGALGGLQANGGTRQAGETHHVASGRLGFSFQEAAFQRATTTVAKCPSCETHVSIHYFQLLAGES
jgi:hypothetical protein